MDFSLFAGQPVMGILRGITAVQLEPLMDAVIESGLKHIEIAMNTPGAPDLIRKAKKHCGNRLVLGAGTVLDMKILKTALDAGATFVIIPVVIPDVTVYCVKNKIPVFPGALTPSEIYRAWQEGASMVKVFPAKVFGPEYFREIKGPFHDIKLMACAGVTPLNLPEYFACGASAVAFGSSVFKTEWLQNKEYSKITGAIREYLLRYQQIIGTLAEPILERDKERGRRRSLALRRGRVTQSQPKIGQPTHL